MVAMLQRSSSEDVVARLADHDSENRIKAVRDIKNQIIGNKSKKYSYIKQGVVPHIVALLSSKDSGLLVQCAATVGSFSYVDAGAHAVLDSGGAAGLLAVLASPEGAVVEAAVRALRRVLESSAEPARQLAAALQGDQLRAVVGLTGSPNPAVAEGAARVLALCTHSRSQQELILESGGVAHLLALLGDPLLPRRAAAAAALAALTDGFEAAAGRVCALPEVPACVERLLGLLRAEAAPPRLVAAQCLAHLAPRLPPEQGCHGCKVRLAALPVLVKLLSAEPEVREAVPGVLALVLRDCPPAARAAGDADAVTALLGLLRARAPPPALLEGTLASLALLSLDSPAVRRQVADRAALGPIVAALDHPERQVQLAAARCVKELLKCVANLRALLAEVDVAAPLLRLLRGGADPGLQAAAAAALCNLVVEPGTAVKEAVVASGALGTLAGLARSSDAGLRRNAAWALSNLAYKADSSVRAALLAALPWSQVAALTADPEVGVQEKALELLQNVFGYTSVADCTKALEWCGREVFRLAVDKANPGAGAPPAQQSSALYTLANISASGGEEGRDAVAGCALPHALPALLRSPEDIVRLPATWIVINLTSSGEEYPGAAARAAALAALGVDAALAELGGDPCLDVRERARTAADNLASGMDTD